MPRIRKTYIDSKLQTIMSSNSEEKILKLYNYLKDENKTKEIGSKILKSMIIDMIRSKLGYIDKDEARNLLIDTNPGGGGGGVWLQVGPVWIRTIPPAWANGYGPNPPPLHVQRTLSEIAAEVELTDEELRIARELGVLKETDKEKE